MKVRLGFVSNSSSSSFVIVVRKDSLKHAPDFVNEAIKEHFDRDVVLGVLCYTFADTFSDHDYPEWLNWLQDHEDNENCWINVENE
jgi:hypothetical protein